MKLFITILFSFIVLVKLMRLSLVYIKGNLTWLEKLGGLFSGTVYILNVTLINKFWG